MIKAVFFDIDGTLIDSETHEIPASTIQACKELRVQGYYTAIASGRDWKTIQTIPNFPLSLFDGFVTSNGMCIYLQDGSLFSYHCFSAHEINHILSYAKKHSIPLIFETLDDLFLVNEANTYVDIANAYYNETTPAKKQWQEEPVIKINCFAPLHTDFSELLSKVDIQVLSSPTTSYDLTCKNVSKRSGIHELMDLWKVAPNAYLCFGDHENDLEMMQGADISVAVLDPLGSPRIQQLADATCMRAKHDGIYNFLKDHGYI